MSYFTLALRLIKKSAVLSVVIVLQLCITIILVNFLIGKYNTLSGILRMTESLSGDDTYLYMPAASSVENENRLSQINALMEKYPEELNFEQPLQSEFPTKDGGYYRVVAQGDRASKAVHSPLEEGKWYTKVQSEHIPCVTYSDHNIGDIIAITIEGQDILFEVVGILANNAKLLTFTAASNEPTLEVLFNTTNENNANSLILCNGTDFPLPLQLSADTNGFVFFETEDQSIREEIIREFRIFSWFVPLESARYESKDQLAIHIKTLAPMVVSIFLVGIVSMLCLTVLHTIHHRRTIAIYTICGMSRGSIILQWIMVFGCQIGLVLLLLLLFHSYNKASQIIPTDAVEFNAANGIVTGIILFTSLMTTVLSHIFINKKEDPIQYIRESW